MRSIRLSLLGYFLVLLALALGVVSFLVYRITEETLGKEETARRALLDEKNADRLKQAGEKLDLALLAQARGLHGIVFFNFDWPTLRRLDTLYALSTISANLFGCPNI